MKIIAFGASYSINSINKTFASYVANQFEATSVEVIDLNQYPLPLYTVDEEKANGVHENAKAFYNKLQEADLLVVSMSEHNGTYTTAFKNLFDWTSRHQLKMFEGKKMFLVSTAPGPRGGKGSMEAALQRFPIHGAEVLGHFCLPKFQENFDNQNGIISEDLKSEFNDILIDVKSKI